MDNNKLLSPENYGLKSEQLACFVRSEGLNHTMEVSKSICTNTSSNWNLFVIDFDGINVDWRLCLCRVLVCDKGCESKRSENFRLRLRFMRHFSKWNNLGSERKTKSDFSLGSKWVKNLQWKRSEIYQDLPCQKYNCHI